MDEVFILEAHTISQDLKKEEISYNFDSIEQIINYITERDWKQELLLRKKNLRRKNYDFPVIGFLLYCDDEAEVGVYCHMWSDGQFEIGYTLPTQSINYLQSTINIYPLDISEVINFIKLYCEKDYNNIIKQLSEINIEGRDLSDDWVFLNKKNNLSIPPLLLILIIVIGVSSLGNLLFSIFG